MASVHGLLVVMPSMVLTALAVCPKPSTPINENLSGCDYEQLTTATYSGCQAACCDDARCVTWNWDSNLTAKQRPDRCQGIAGCCWLKSCGKPGPNCGEGGQPGCESWSGSAGRSPPTPSPPAPPPCPPGEKCFWNQGSRPARKHAWEFAKATLPERGSFKSAYEALQLDVCGVPTPAEDDVFQIPTFPTPTEGNLLYVDCDAPAGGDGTEGNPFNTLEDAVKHVGTANRGSTRTYAGSRMRFPAPAVQDRTTILLKAGTYHTAGVTLTPAHSGLTIQNYQGADVVVSGAVPVKSTRDKWTLHDTHTNTWVLDTTEQSLPVEFGMRVKTPSTRQGHGEEIRRAIRAKYPNGDPETAPSYCIIPLGSIASPGVYLNGSGVSEDYPVYFPRSHENTSLTQQWYAGPSDWPSVFWHDSDGHHPRSIGGYGPYFYAAGGVCSGRRPSHGYWCAENPRGQIGQHLIDPPGGFEFEKVLPQAAKYKNPKGAIFHARGGSMPYFSYMCLVDEVNVSEGKVYFNHAIGCDQGGPTPQQPGKAWDWYIENVLEECDSPGEYFFDADAERLYYTFNATETPTGDEEFFLTRTKVIFNISGTMLAPVADITIQGLTIRDAAFTYLGTTTADEHWLPSEGDWALQRSGAVTMEGVQDIAIHKNQFTRCDGNGIFLGGYTRNVNITANDMNWIGDSAMAAFGWTSDCLNENCSVKLPAKVGPDGRAGEQPRNTYVGGNVVREFGIWQKQSSAWFQALSTTTTLESNVFFNGPRAAINFNDAFGGGDLVVGNLLFNMVRETVDHGTLNAWERGPYISDVGYIADNTTSLTPTVEQLMAGATPGFKLQPDGSTRGSVVGQYRRLVSNFLLGTYNVNSNLETDDGSSRYLLYNNYFVYATSATDFAMNAHWNYYVNNVHAYGESAMRGWSGCHPTVCTEPYGNSANNVYLYNSTFYLLGDFKICAGNFLGSVLDTSVLHANGSHSLDDCTGAVTDKVSLAPPAPDSAVTAKAKGVLRDYPKPYA